ncbi:putative secreted protein (Por secretion system target) [Algoriphagus boseongensis]|uniref:Putative secreted protein (Por secretion system target) n=1 Tax=Algoriphagus boseongensis TaxID=1442587 RepID=A0A4R6T582_9BACT|nr:fibronectin type III domain-containing protein [Algoriphagus boseongensis]TDQ16439.1 putative secreted protein (Por secretion system target) [Algoriphagus boseongensis]
MKKKLHIFLSLLLVIICFVGLSIPGFSQGNSADKRIDIWKLMERRDMKLQEIDALAKRFFDAVGRTRGTGFKQYERWKYEQQFHLDENGYFLPEGFDQQQYEQAALMASATQGTWTEIGPTYWNRTSGWNPGVGRITSIAVSPSNPNIIYVTTPGGGMWKSTQGGNQWIPLADYDNSMMTMYSVTVHPSNPNIVYGGKTNGTILKSLDGGFNWTSANSNVGTVYKILFHPTDPTILFAVGSSGISKSIDGGNSFVRKSTVFAEDIEFLPENLNVLIASDNQVQRSTDGGETWTTLGSSQGLSTTGRTLVAVSPASPLRVYAVQASGSVFGRMYRSDDGGATFYTTVIGSSSSGTNYFGYETSGTGTTGQAGYDMAMTVNPNNADEVHIAGIICWKSTNGGYSFSPTTAWSLPNSIGYNHADVHVLEWVGNTIYSGSDGGIYKSIDYADNWTDLTSGLGIRQFYRISNSKTNPALVMGGAQDNGTSIYKNNGWIDWLGADGMDNIVSPLDANLIWGTSQYGSMYRTTNGGSSYSSISEPATGNWVTPIAVESNTNTIYAGWNGVYRSTDLGVSWTKISGNVITSNLNTLFVAPSDSKYIYASVGGTLYVTNDGGSNWSNYSIGSTISSIGIHPNNPERIWITTTSSANRLLYSEDAGATISNISTGLPSMAGRSVVIDDTPQEGVYVGMNIGVYYKNNQMTSWVNMTENLPLVAVNEVELVPNAGKIRVGTYGRGIWESPIYSACPGASNLSANPVGSTTATLNWTAAPGATEYLVEYKRLQDANWTLATSATSATQWSLTGLIQQTTYEWRITSVCSGGNGSAATSQFTTGVTCQTPQGLQTSAINTNSATLAWQALSGVLGYSVDYRKVGDTNWINLTQGTNQTQINLNNLSEGTGYEWRVQAICTEGGGSYSQAQFTTAITCNAPSNLNTSGITSNSAILNWASVSGASGYDLDFRTSGSSNWILLASNHPQNSYPLGGLAENTNYEWRVRTNCGTLSGTSSYLQSQFTTLVQVCEDIYESNETRTAAKVIGTSPINARIGSTTDQDWFEIPIGNGKNTNLRVNLEGLTSNTFLYLYNSSGNLLASSEAVNSATQTVIYNSGTSRTSYFILVKGDGQSFSNSCYTLLAETSTKAFTNPNSCDAPTGLTTPNVDLNSATVSWNAVSNGLDYQVEYKLATSSTWIVAASNTPGTSLTLSGLKENQNYNWRVKANCSISTSTYSSSSFTTASNFCVDLYENNDTRQDAKTISTGSVINATISSSSDEDWFAVNLGKGRSTNLRISLDGLPANFDLYLYNSSGQLISSSNNGGINPEQIVWNSSNSSTTYYIQVISATGENSTSCYSLLVETSTKAYPVANRELNPEDTSTDTEIPELEFYEGIRLYPNPSRDKIYLEFYSSVSFTGNLELLDMSGKSSWTQSAEVKVGENRIELDVSREKPGIYLIRLQSNRTLMNRKIIIQ